MLHKCCNEHEDKKKKAHGTKVEIHDREEHYVNEKNNWESKSQIMEAALSFKKSKKKMMTTLAESKS